MLCGHRTAWIGFGRSMAALALVALAISSASAGEREDAYRDLVWAYRGLKVIESVGFRPAPNTEPQPSGVVVGSLFPENKPAPRVVIAPPSERRTQGPLLSAAQAAPSTQPAPAAVAPAPQAVAVQAAAEQVAVEEVAEPATLEDFPEIDYAEATGQVVERPSVEEWDALPTAEVPQTETLFATAQDSLDYEASTAAATSAEPVEPAALPIAEPTAPAASRGAASGTSAVAQSVTGPAPREFTEEPAAEEIAATSQAVAAIAAAAVDAPSRDVVVARASSSEPTREVETTETDDAPPAGERSLRLSQEQRDALAAAQALLEPQEFARPAQQEDTPIVMPDYAAAATAAVAAESQAASALAPITNRARPATGQVSGQAARPVAFQPLEDVGDPFIDDPAAFNGPFEVIEQTGELTVRLRQNKLLRTRFDIYRTAVVDSTICEVVQFTPREVAILGKAQGATQVTFWFDDGEHRPVTYLIRVQPDPEERRRHEDQYALLEELLRELFPDSDVDLLPMADKLVIRGQAKDSAEASQILAIIREQVDRQTQNYSYGTLGDGNATDVLFDDETGRMNPRIQVINLLEVPGVQQVALRVKIAELNRTAARGMGVDVAGNIEIGNSSAVLIDSLLNVAAGQPPALIGALDGNDLEIGLRYLTQHGVVRMLSEPTLVTLSGRPATFVAGGEFAVPTVVGVGGASAVTTDFRSFGAVVSFLPVVLDKDRIRLEVAPEFSQINENLSVGDTPGLNVRAVTTTVEMREGQTLAIAGLLDDSMSGNTAGDLPFISHLFGRRDMTHSETELIILVTPELVSPMEPEEVPPLPGFDVTEPTNKEFYWRGELEGRPTQEYRSTVWPHLQRRYRAGGPSVISGPFGHGQ